MGRWSFIVFAFLAFLAYESSAYAAHPGIHPGVVDPNESEFSTVLALADTLFADKTLQGDDGVTQVFSKLKHFSSTHWITAKITTAGGSQVNVVDTFALTPDGILLIEDVKGQPTANYPVTVTATGGLLFSSKDPASKFISRECFLTKGKTNCLKTIKLDDDTQKVIQYRQIKPAW